MEIWRTSSKKWMFSNHLHRPHDIRTTVMDFGVYSCLLSFFCVSRKMKEVALEWPHLSHVLRRLDLKLWCGRGLQCYVLWTVRLALSWRSSQKTPCTHPMGAIVHISQVVIIKCGIEISEFLASTSKIKIYNLAHWSLGQAKEGTPVILVFTG